MKAKLQIEAEGEEVERTHRRASETPDCSGGGRGGMDSSVRSSSESPTICKSSVATGKTELLPSFEYDESLAPESKEHESWLLSVANGEVPLSRKGSKPST